MFFEITTDTQKRLLTGFTEPYYVLQHHFSIIQEVREYLNQLSEDCSKAESCGRDIPVVLILDDLHRSTSLTDAFRPLLTAAAHSQLPFLIGR